MSDATLARGQAGNRTAMATAVEVLSRDLDAYGREHGGIFTLFGSAARDELRADSDVDILVDFPGRGEDEAWCYAESRAFALGLKPDITPASFAGPKLLDEIDKDQQGSMTDARARRLAIDTAASSVRHFTAAIAIFDEGTLTSGSPDSYRDLMAFLHAMQAGHTSLENSLRRLIWTASDQPGRESDWHARLIELAARPQAGRAAILPPDVAAAADETRRFRHVAMHNYDFTFEPAKAERAVAAASIIVDQLASLVDLAGSS